MAEAAVGAETKEKVSESEEEKKKKPKKKRSKPKIIITTIIVIIIGLIAALLVYLTLNEYDPPETEQVAASQGTIPLTQGANFTVTTLNTGYGGLSADADFFMDGGSGVRAESDAVVRENVNGIAQMLTETGGQILLLQEVDLNSDRTFDINEVQFYEEKLGMPGAFAYNYNCKYVPYPLPKTIGHVESGLVTLTNFQSSSAQRVQLPVPFTWPMRIANLKRCLLVEYFPIEGTDRQLVVVNLHLEAYDDDGRGKKAQTQMLREILTQEYQKGNYVIAGGDFNQTFEGAAEWPVVNTENWAPGSLTFADLPEGFSFQFDTAVPTCRLLDAPYTEDYTTSQVYTLDGFIVSANVQVNSCATADYGFQYTDHQPVVMNVTLLP